MAVYHRPRLRMAVDEGLPNIEDGDKRAKSLQMGEKRGMRPVMERLDNRSSVRSRIGYCWSCRGHSGLSQCGHNTGCHGNLHPQIRHCAAHGPVMTIVGTSNRLSKSWCRRIGSGSFGIILRAPNVWQFWRSLSPPGHHFFPRNRLDPTGWRRWICTRRVPPPDLVLWATGRRCAAGRRIDRWS
jgi:hypothetical protein